MALRTANCVKVQCSLNTIRPIGRGGSGGANKSSCLPMRVPFCDPLAESPCLALAIQCLCKGV